MQLCMDWMPNFVWLIKFCVKDPGLDLNNASDQEI